MAVKESDKAHDRSPKNHPRRIGSAGLINAAYDFISMHGLDRLTFRHIANQANCSLGTLTYHFSSRDDLISAVLSDKILPAMQQGALLPHHSDPAIAFLEAIKNGLPYNETTKDYWRVRLGVGRPERKSDVHKWVLQDFAKAEQSGWLDSLLTAMTSEAGLLASGDANSFMSRVAYLAPAPAATTEDND